MRAKLNNCVAKRETYRVQTNAVAILEFFLFKLVGATCVLCWNYSG